VVAAAKDDEESVATSTRKQRWRSRYEDEGKDEAAAALAEIVASAGARSFSGGLYCSYGILWWWKDDMKV
jgi:hypothetical protein